MTKIGDNKKWIILSILLFFVAFVYLAILFAFKQFFNDNSNVITLFFSTTSVMTTIVLVLVTFAYVELTSKLVDETRRTREAQNEPRINVFLEIKDGDISTVYTTIKNDGTGPAFKIKLKSDQDFVYHDNKKISELGAFKQGIGYLGPNRERKIFRTFTLQKMQKGENINDIKLNIGVDYESTSGHQYHEECLLDFSEFENYMIVTTPLTEIADNFEKIPSNIRNIVNELREIRQTIETIKESGTITGSEPVTGSETEEK